ncbi:MAG: hypothetical protein IKT73_07980 [Anaerotignum sp.]|nr:hypothetical protein [Anaerotignum sp.]
MIKDSGNRTAFSTGAVRDMQDNKGRCDLLPLDEVQSVLEDKNDILDYLESYKRTEDTEFLEFALRQFASIAYDGDRIGMILDVAEHYAEGAEKYGVDNWKKGLPEWSYLSSGTRHYLKWLRGDEDERHDRAFVWNILCLLWTIENVREDVLVND